MRAVDFPWGITHEGKVCYFDPYDDWGRDDAGALNFMTRFSSEANAQVARRITRQAHKVIHDLVEAQDADRLAELFVQLEEFILD
jgi:hypothetical protein